MAAKTAKSEFAVGNLDIPAPGNVFRSWTEIYGQRIENRRPMLYEGKRMLKDQPLSEEAWIFIKELVNPTTDFFFEQVKAHEFDIWTDFGPKASEVSIREAAQLAEGITLMEAEGALELCLHLDWLKGREDWYFAYPQAAKTAGIKTSALAA